MSRIRPCRGDERDAVLAIINAAAAPYRGVIPADRWHEPYMDSRELQREIVAGIRFWGYEAHGGRRGSVRRRYGSATSPSMPARPSRLSARRS
jgi:hypothetical protein